MLAATLDPKPQKHILSNTHEKQSRNDTAQPIEAEMHSDSHPQGPGQKAREDKDGADQRGTNDELRGKEVISFEEKRKVVFFFLLISSVDSKNLNRTYAGCNPSEQ